MFNKILLRIFIGLGSKLFGQVSVYSPEDVVKAITFTNDEEYLDKVTEFMDENMPKEKVCDHNWTSAKNEVIKSGSFCPKCLALSAKEPEELIGEKQ